MSGREVLSCRNVQASPYEALRTEEPRVEAEHGVAPLAGIYGHRFRLSSSELIGPDQSSGLHHGRWKVEPDSMVAAPVLPAATIFNALHPSSSLITVSMAAPCCWEARLYRSRR